MRPGIAFLKGGYSPAIQEDIKQFNGGLFHDAIAVEITEDELTLLEKAARRDWHSVEPAIFGTLLEQALSARDRSRLGAHYTPRWRLRSLRRIADAIACAAR